jgi:hypothetical protein
MDLALTTDQDFEITTKEKKDRRCPERRTLLTQRLAFSGRCCSTLTLKTLMVVRKDFYLLDLRYFPSDDTQTEKRKP